MCVAVLDSIVINDRFSFSRMSWISDLAGKAESLLERVDKTAHTALQKDGQSNEISGDSSSAAVLELGSDVTAAPPATRAAPELPAAVGNMQRSASAGTLMPGTVLYHIASTYMYSV